MCVMSGKIVSFQPVVHYNQIYLVLIGIVAFLTQLQMLHILRYHKTISILGSTLTNALSDLLSFGLIMGIVFFAFTCAIYLLYHDLEAYSTMVIAMCTQVGASCSRVRPVVKLHSGHENLYSPRMVDTKRETK